VRLSIGLREMEKQIPDMWPQSASSSVFIFAEVRWILSNKSLYKFSYLSMCYVQGWTQILNSQQLDSCECYDQAFA
jgi:hypothetical protein